MNSLRELPNIGKVLERNLNEIGVTTPKQLAVMGYEEAFIRIRLIDPGACLHMLYGLCGAIEGIRYTQLLEETKVELQDFFKRLS